MNGFPNRPGRKTFGPQLKNARAIANPELEADADTFNLLFAQIAGAGLMVARAWALIDGTGGSTTARIVAHAESWNPDQNTAAPYTPPQLGYTSTGIYTLTYQPTYPDDSGSAVATGILAPWAIVTGTSNVRNAVASVAGAVITVRLKEFSAGAFNVIDGPVLVGFM